MSGPRVVHWVVPAYNEAASITDLIDRIADVSAEQDWAWDLLVVDDGSIDETRTLVQAHSTTQKLPVIAAGHTPNQGLGVTIREGLRAASEAAEPDDVLVTLDADLTQDPSYAPAMLERLAQGCDVVIASRYRHGSTVEGLSLPRRFLSRAANALVALVRPIRGVRDYSCGFRAYRASAIKAGFARYGDDLVRERGFACMLELALRLRDTATFAEVPFTLRYQQKRKPSEIEVLPTIAAYSRVISASAPNGDSRTPR